MVVLQGNYSGSVLVFDVKLIKVAKKNIGIKKRLSKSRQPSFDRLFDFNNTDGVSSSRTENEIVPLLAIHFLDSIGLRISL
jgi:hypothetical protein